MIDYNPVVSSLVVSRYRWWILALIFFATTINYLDRILFSVLIPVIRSEMHINDQQYGYLTAAFQLAYTVGFLFAGKLIDRFGTRLGYTVSVVLWSLAAMLHAVSRSAVDLGFWRGMLGFSESGNFPAAIKAVAEWFPKKDRAFATAIFNSGTNIASILGPPLFVVMNEVFGWRSAFILTGATGFIWVALWLVLYRNPPAPEADEPQEQVGWLAALRYRQTWGFAIGKFLTDPVWWFYLFWLPPYLYDVRHLDLKQIGWALPVTYVMASIGGLGGGWLSGYFIRKGWDVGRSRRVAMTIAAICMPVSAMAVFAPGPILAILLVSVATAAHQAWSANIFTTTSDVFPKNVVASVTGIGGCAGGLGGVIFSAVLPGFVVPHFGYAPVFILMGVLHLSALAVIRALLWRKPLQAVRAL